MAKGTPKTFSELNSLFPDNKSGNISPADARDLIATAVNHPDYVPVWPFGSDGTRSERATAVQGAIDHASSEGKAGVLVQDSYLDYDASAVTFDSSVRMIREGQVADVYDVVAYGADSANTGAANTESIQGAIAGAKASGGGVVTVRTPGTYDLDEAGANPYEAGHRHCLDIDGDDITLRLGEGVTLKLADDQQTDANGPVDMIVFRDRSGVVVEGVGSGTSRITGNTAGQTNWTGGYSQGNNGNLIRGDGTTGNGNSGIIVRGLQLDDHFSNPVQVLGGTVDLNENIQYIDLHCIDCGEGPIIETTDGALYDRVRVEDPSNVCVGDGIEPSRCNNVTITRCEVLTNGAGSAFDIFGCQGVVVSDFIVDGWNSGFSFATTGGGRITDDVTVSNGVIRNLTSSVGAFDAGEGHVMIDNVEVRNNGSLAFQLNGVATMKRMTIRGCRFVDNALAGQVRAATQVDFVDCEFIGEEPRIRDAGTGDPNFSARSCRFTGTDGVEIDGAGSAFSPSGAVIGCVFDGVTNPINAVNSGTFDNVDLDANVRIADADRPAAGIAGRQIFNTGDSNLNIDTGSDWILPDGTSATT